MINKNRNITIQPVKERTAFQVGQRIFRTKDSAAKAQAWNWILSKYDTSFYISDGGKQIQDIQKVLDLECSCSNYYGCDGCELHDRRIGYFSRLAKAISKRILKYWNK
jgi:hypothetical protein